MSSLLRLCARCPSDLMPVFKNIVRTGGTGGHASHFNYTGLGTTRFAVVKSVPIRCIRTSASKRSPLKFVILFIRPFLAMIGGRIFRKWWSRLTPEQRLRYTVKLNRNRWKMYSGIAMYVTTLLVYYISHCQRTPFTGRLRFMAFDGKTIKELTAKVYGNLLAEYGHKVLPPEHPDALRVLAVTRKIVAGNSDLVQFKDVHWEVTVIDDPGVLNAMVTPDGRITVFKDFLQLCATDDELAIILCHEISHALLDHVAEKISNVYFMGYLTAPFLARIWAVVPSDLMSLVVTWIYRTIINIAIDLPYSRFTETEADDVGLQLAARACFDVRQSVDFWQRINMIINNVTRRNSYKKLFQLLCSTFLGLTKSA